MSHDPDDVWAIEVLAEEVVGGQLGVVPDQQVDPASVAQLLSELLMGVATFSSYRAVLSADGEALLDHAIESLLAYPASRLIVEGQTDAEGDAAAFMELSQQRAEALVAYVIAGGFSAERVTAIGYGEECPIA